MDSPEYGGFPTITMAANMFIVSTTNYLVPYNPPPQTTVNFYFGGGTFIGSNGVYGFNNLVFNSQTALNYFLNNTQGANCNSACEILQYYYFSPPTTPSCFWIFS